MGRAARTVRGPGLDCRTHKGFEFRSIPRRVCAPTGRFLVCATLYRDVRFLQQVRTSGTTVSFGLCEAEGKPRARATIRGLNRSQQPTRAQPDRIKRGRRVATRYDKFAANYPAIHQARTDSHLVACSWARAPTPIECSIMEGDSWRRQQASSLSGFPSSENRPLPPARGAGKFRLFGCFRIRL